MENRLGFFGVIQESLKTTSRNRKLLVPFLLLVFLSYSELDFLQEYELAPYTNYFMWQLTNHPNIVHDYLYNTDQTSYIVDTIDTFREIVIIKLMLIELSLFITLVFLVATICSSSEAYTTKLLSRKDIFLKICRSWSRSVLTSFHLILLSFGVAFLFVIVIVIISFLAVNSWAVLLVGVIAVSIPVCYVYMATIWIISLIVSVLEEGSSGLKAIWRAGQLMKGKRLEASLIMVLFVLADGLVVVVARVVTSYGWSLSTELAIRIPFTNGFYCLVKVFMFVVYTVFYHEWKASHDVKEGKGFYLPIANVKA